MTQVFATLVVLMAMRVGSIGGVFDWCKHDCKPKAYGMPPEKHTMCQYEKGGGPQCSRYQMGLTKEEQQAIVDLHNQLRATVANGQESRGAGGEQPPAADMMEMVWDDEVAEIAQRWADQCRIGGHDSCRKTMDDMSIGQNAGAMSGYGMNPARLDMVSDRIKAWYNEVIKLVPSDVDSVFRSSTGMVGHYTQVVWGRSTRIGCGMAHLQGGSFAVKLVCNYKPAGNYGGMKIYTKGDPASQCPPNSDRSNKYSGLCKPNDKYVDTALPTMTPDMMGLSPFGQMPQFGSSAFPGDSRIPASIFEVPVSAGTGKPQMFEIPMTTTGGGSQIPASIFKIPISSNGGKPQLLEIPIASPNDPSSSPTDPSTLSTTPMMSDSPRTGLPLVMVLPVEGQAPVQQPDKKKKPSLFWRIITLPWRILKWFLSIPFRIFEFIKNKFFN